MDFEAVDAAIRAVEAAEIAPRFGALTAGDIEEKSPGEVVTAADRAAEAALTPLLRDIQDAVVVGEEATAADPSLPALLDHAPAAWLVDPVDGTSNFCAGSPDYAVMVAFVEAGRTTASWIWQPAYGVMARAALGSGAEINGASVRAVEPDPGDRPLAGVVRERFLPPEVAARVRDTSHRFQPHAKGTGSAGLDYPQLVAGATDFLVYWRTLAWDHAPGVLFAGEAGCTALRPDGQPYRPGSTRSGLLVAHESIDEHLRRSLLG